MKLSSIPFNKPWLTGRELEYITDALTNGKISGNGKYTGLCHQFFNEKYGFTKCLLTTSCTDALEMAAILLDIQPGDEVIMPSYTFVSTVNAFVLRGATIVFADSSPESPNMNIDRIGELINKKTVAIVIVHYAGVSCDMDKVMELASENNLKVIEDAAHAIDSFFTNKQGVKMPLGSIGNLAAFSFHETKNIISGEGGMLVINDPQFEKRAEIIWEKGTNRAAFFRGEVDKYNWVDIGSSFMPSELIAACLYAQLQYLAQIQVKRVAIWNQYCGGLKELEDEGFINLPVIPEYATNNAHTFYLVCKNAETRDELISYLKGLGISAVFHYVSLHNSPYYQNKHDGRTLKYCDLYTERLLRLPLFYELSHEQVQFIIDSIKCYFQNLRNGKT